MHLLDVAPILPVITGGIALVLLFVIVPGLVVLAVFLIRRAIKNKQKKEDDNASA